MKTKNKRLSGFTLVELIVVITILVILGTIGFVSIQGFSSSARDSTRVSDLIHLSKGLEFAYIKTSSYPTPDNSFFVTHSGGILWNQGTVGDPVVNILSSVGTKLSKKPTDPLIQNKEYTYSTLAFGNGYQLKADWEGEKVVHQNNLINQANASSSNPTLVYIKGNYNGMVVKTITGGIIYLVATPSMVTSQIGAIGTGIDIISTLPNKLLINGQTNSGGIAFVPRIVFSSGALPINDDEKITFASGIANAYSTNSMLATQSNIKAFIDAGNNTESLATLGGNLAASLVGGGGNNNIGNGGKSVIPPLCGSSHGTTVASNGFFPSLCSGTGTVIAWSGVGGTSTGSTLSWTCQNGTQTGSCSATYNKPTTGIGGQACDTYDKLIGSLTGSYQVWSMCNMGAYKTWTGGISFTNTGAADQPVDYNSNLHFTIGSYYSWGRNEDVTSLATGSLLASTGSLSDTILGRFIVGSNEWISPKNDDLWGGSGTTSTNGTYLSQGSPTTMQGPCPTGYHIPTEYEWRITILTINPGLSYASPSWQSDTLISSRLKLPASGFRHYTGGGVYSYQGVTGYYWSSSPNGISAYVVGIDGGGVSVCPLTWSSRSMGFSVRCLKN